MNTPPIDELVITPYDYESENPILMPLLHTTQQEDIRTREALRAEGKGVVDVIRVRQLTEDEVARGVRGSATDNTLRPSEENDFSKSREYRRTIGAVRAEDERNSRGMTLNADEVEVPLNPPTVRRSLGKAALWGVSTTIASYLPASKRISAPTTTKIHGVEFIVPGKPGASAREVRNMHDHNSSYRDILRTIIPKNNAAEQNQSEQTPKRLERVVESAKSAIKYTARTITNIDKAYSKKLNDYVDKTNIYTAERKATRLRRQAEELNWQNNSHRQNRDSAGAVSKKTTRQLAKTISRKSSRANWKLANASHEEAVAAGLRRRASQNRDTL